MTGSDLIIKILTEHGVTRCFGYPGGAAMQIYDSLYRYKRRIKHIRTAHEQGAAHAADGYARASGKLGVCFATSGPGATNLITGIATAYADSVPMLVVTANVSVSEIGTDSFQEADITGMTLSVTKYNWIVKKPENLASTLYKAIKLAESGRPGPVLVDVPRDILSFRFSDKYDYRRFSDTLGDNAEDRTPILEKPDDNEIEEAAELINASEKPFIICGGGIAMSGDRALSLIRELSEKLKAPVSNTLMATGLLPTDNPLYAGMIGKYGLDRAKKAITEADLIVCVAMRFSNRTHQMSLSGKKIIHIDADRAEVNKNVHASLSLVGDAGEVLERLVPSIKTRKTCRFSLENGDDGKHESEKQYLKVISDALPKNVTVVTDVGTHQMTVAKYFPFDGKKRLITSGGFGTMGFGIGAAAGAKIANPEGEVVLFTGDGSFKMGAAELLMLKENKLKILIAVINNASLGMVRDMQKCDFGGRFMATEERASVPNIPMLARAYGLKGAKIESAEDLSDALETYKKSRCSMVLDIRV